MRSSFDLSSSFIWKVSIFCGLFILITLNFFLWGRNLNTCNDNVTIDHEVWGTFGDFIGGFLGTILALLSAFLMYWTFQSQREQTRNSDDIQKRIAQSTNEAQARIAADANCLQERLTKLSNAKTELQRFNDLFFNLLNNYKNAVNSHNTDGMNVFDRAMQSLSEQFVAAPQYGKSVEKASKRYTKFYLENASQIAPIFRTLYRIMELIDKANIPNEEKLRYVKIVRAQLSESELFCLRYNCMTPYGENFIEYINKYHLLKHLPLMSLLEFRKFRMRLSNNESIYLSLNILFHRAWRTIHQITLGRLPREDIHYIIDQSKRYTIYLDMTAVNETTISLNININSRNTVASMRPLSRLSYEELELFLKFFLQEVYRYSNFQSYNDDEGSSLRFTSMIDYKVGSILIKATARVRQSLRLSHPDHDGRYGL